MLKNLENLIVLYVEDDKFTRHLIKQALQSIVHKVYLAKNGIEGLKLYELTSPHIVLTDRYMPHMGGIEMSQKIKLLRPEQPIGLFTGDAEQPKIQSSEIDAYLTKPLNRKEFLNTLEYLASLALFNESCEIM